MLFCQYKTAISMKPILISKLINKQLGKHLGSNNLYPVIKNWHRIVGSIIFRIAVPVKIKKNTLIVGVTTHQWLQELSFSKETMLKKIKEYSRTIMDVQFILKSDIKKGPAKDIKKDSAASRPRASLSAADITFIKSAVVDVKDEELKEIFENILKISLSNKKAPTK